MTESVSALVGELARLSAMPRIAVASRSLLRLLPAYEPGPRTALARLAVATVEAIAYRAALTLEAAEPTGHRATAKAASALLPAAPGRALSEAVNAYETGDSESAGRLAGQEIEEICARLRGNPLEGSFLASGEEDVRFLLERDAALDFRAFFARPLFGPAAPVPAVLTGWSAFLRELGLLEVMARRYQDLLHGRFPDSRLLLAILDAWADQIERLPLGDAAPAGGLPEEVAGRAASGEASVPREDAAPPQGNQAVGRFTALDESLAERDLLDRQPLVDALASMCADPDQGTPFTFALIGEWGIGKSSAMHLLRRKLSQADGSSKDRFATVWFNAWAYENTGNMAAALAHEIVGGLLAGLNRRQKTRIRFRFALRQHRWGVAWASLRLLFAAFLLPAASLAIRGAGPFLQSLLGVGLAAGLGAFAISLRRDIKQLWEHPLTVELKTFLKLPDYGEHLGLLPVVKEHLRVLCDLRLGSSRAGRQRLVCFIDDLDRCRSDTLIQTLEAIRLVMDEKDCIVIMGFDYRIALAAVGERYKDFETKDRSRWQIARDYLGKVVQLVIRLDGADAVHLERFIAEQLFPVPPEAPNAGAAAVPMRGSPVAARSEPAAASRPPLARPGSVTAPPPAAASAVVQPVDLALEMKHTSEERQLFSRLAAEHRFTNPRQLLRLRNGYRLLRLIEAQLGLDQSWSRLPMPVLMRAIFWQEFLNQWPSERRRELEAAVFSDSIPDALPALTAEVLLAVAPRFQDLLGRGESAQAAYRSVVDLASVLVLPPGD